MRWDRRKFQIIILGLRLKVDSIGLPTYRILYEVVRTGKYAWRCVDAPTTNGRTRMTGPQQTTDSSLIVLCLICSYTKRYMAMPVLNVQFHNRCPCYNYNY